jgi:hypothetical protein
MLKTSQRGQMARRSMRIGTQQQVACVQMQHRHLISCLVASLRGIASRIAALRLRVGIGRKKGVRPNPLRGKQIRSSLAVL